MSAPGPEDWSDPGHLGGRWRSAILRSPVGLTVLGVAACSVALSVAGFFALSRALELPRTHHFPYYLAIAIVIPVFVSVPISWVIVRLLREVDVARRLAERLASNDALTGLLNRRRFAELSRRELGLALRTGTPLTALLIDLDDFKRVNDRLGHAEGDRLLEATARRILGALRSTDLAARWGGEEFALLLPGSGLDDGVAVAQRILQSLRELAVGEGDDRHPCTASIGVAASAGAGEDFDPLIDRADRAMYAAKLAGKNRVERALPPQPG